MLESAGQLVRLRRVKLGWTQIELAIRLGVSQAAVAQIESGIAGPALVALALFIVRMPDAGARVAQLPRKGRSKHAQRAHNEVRRIERGQRVRRGPGPTGGRER